MRTAAVTSGDLDRMQAWAGQSAALGRAEPAAQLVSRVWKDAQAILAFPDPFIAFAREDSGDRRL
jgi:nitronate monooxygenase